MHIETEIDDIDAERLLAWQRRTSRPLPELVADLLKQALAETSPPPPKASETDGQRIYRLFDEAGLIGCGEGDGRLSTDYKQRLWSKE